MMAGQGAPRWALALHGGAGVKAGRDYTRAEACLARLVQRGASRLQKGHPALDVVEDLTAEMEASGLFVAGRGSAPNILGQVELDASLMDGSRGPVGAVAALQGVASPIRVARRLLDRGSPVLLVGQGAQTFADDAGCERVTDVTLWLTTPDGSILTTSRTDMARSEPSRSTAPDVWPQRPPQEEPMAPFPAGSATAL